MSEWRAETEDDLAAAAKGIEAVLAGPPGALTGDQVRHVWFAYIKVEKSVAFIKFDIDEENPGRFIPLKSYSVPDDRQSLSFALKYLRKGSDQFALGDFVRALKDLRECRNYLRALLREKRLDRARRARRP